MASIIAASASPRRDDTRQLSPSKAAGLLHDQPHLKSLRDQSPKPGAVVQPVVSYSGHGAVITTAGPKTTDRRSTSPMSYLAAAVSPSCPDTAAADDVAVVACADTPARQQQQEKLQSHQHRAAVEPAGERATAAAAGIGKRAMRQLSSNDSFTRAQLAPKRQVLDHHTAEGTAQQGAEQQQQAVGDTGHSAMVNTDTAMGEAGDIGLQQQQQVSLQQPSSAASRLSVQTPFCAVPASLQRRDSLDIDDAVQHHAGIGRTGSSSGASTAATAPGRMLPPSTTGQRMLILPHANSTSSSSAAAAAASIPNTILAGEGELGLRCDNVSAAAARGAVESPIATVTVSPTGEASLSLNNILATKATISSAASLEGWLPNTAVGEAIAAAVAAAGGSHCMLRTGSTASTATASMARQGSLSFPLSAHPSQQQHGTRLGSATLETQDSFAGWPGSSGGAGQGSAGSSSTLNREGSFSWPRVTPAHIMTEDSLKLDIQVLSPVIPEDYPQDEPAEADGTTQQLALPAQLQAAREAQQRGDRAFFAKVASWEAELVDMLERQSAPVAIRQIVAVFKDRINTERDKSEFKSICDKWTSVVEYPIGSGVKCLAIKSWMRSECD